ncbi:MAG: glycosyltransferase, partial [Verrucomicrobiota bacterium]
MSEPIPPIATSLSRIENDGKFFSSNGSRWFARIADCTKTLPEIANLESFGRDLQDLGYNTLRVLGRPSAELLEMARNNDFRLLISLDWNHDVDFLQAKSSEGRKAKEQILTLTKEFGDDPILMGMLIADRIPSTLVRWMGPRRMQKALGELIELGEKAAAQCQFGYRNFAPTDYLRPPGQDLVSFCVELSDRDELRTSLKRLQVQAGDLPLVVNASPRDEIEQRWFLEECARAGVAGVEIAGEPKAIKEALPTSESAFRPRLEKAPQISVVVCTHRRHRLLRGCLEALQKLDYPELEVVIVNDGNDEEVERVVADFPEMRHLSLNHSGLSAARNLGAAKATGEIIAFTDDDCEVDREWLFWLAKFFEDSEFAAAGGPNIAPAPTNWEQACIIAAPGGPCHVMLDDEEAEHVAGCNLAVRKSAWEAIGGFDEKFRKAGDDVDFCWRLRNAGFRIGFCPPAFVWHQRRFSFPAYVRQQIGYGDAEGLLISAHPDRCAGFGPIRWEGCVYEHEPATGVRVFHGQRGDAASQVVYAEPGKPTFGQIDPRFRSNATEMAMHLIAGWAKFRRGLKRVATSWRFPRFRQIDGFPSGHDAMAFRNSEGLDRHDLLDA